MQSYSIIIYNSLNKELKTSHANLIAYSFIKRMHANELVNKSANLHFNKHTTIARWPDYYSKIRRICFMENI